MGFSTKNKYEKSVSISLFFQQQLCLEERLFSTKGLARFAPSHTFQKLSSFCKYRKRKEKNVQRKIRRESQKECFFWKGEKKAKQNFFSSAYSSSSCQPPRS